MGKKIDILIDGKYLWTTAVHKRCKDAKKSFWELYLGIRQNNTDYSTTRYLNRQFPKLTEDRISAFFNRN